MHWAGLSHGGYTLREYWGRCHWTLIIEITTRCLNLWFVRWYWLLLTVPGKRTTRLALRCRESGLAEAPSINSAWLVSAVPVVWWGEFLTCVDRIMFPCHFFVIWLWATYVSRSWLYTDAGNNTSWVLYDIRSCMWHGKHLLMIKHHHGAHSTWFHFGKDVWLMSKGVGMTDINKKCRRKSS